jgi:hypothetical protein
MATEVAGKAAESSTAGKTIEINPVTRLEGHGKVTIHLDDNGNVVDAKFHVTQFRGFEKFSKPSFSFCESLRCNTWCGAYPSS